MSKHNDIIRVEGDDKISVVAVSVTTVSAVDSETNGISPGLASIRRSELLFWLTPRDDGDDGDHNAGRD